MDKMDNTLSEVTYMNFVVSECLIYTFYPILSIVSIIVASIFKASIDDFQEFTEVNLNVVPALVISAGALGVIFLCMKVCMSKGQHKHFVCFVVFPVLLVLQITALVYGCIQAADNRRYLKKSIENEMGNVFYKFYYNNKSVEARFNAMQHELECCGVLNQFDYKNHQLPISCCPIESFASLYCVDVATAYKDGCASKIYSDVIFYIAVLSYITILLVVFQIFVGAYIVNVIWKYIRARNSEYTSM